MIFGLYYLKSLSGALDTNQFKKALTEDVKKELATVVARIIEDSCSDAKNNTQLFQMKDIPLLETWLSRFSLEY